MGDPHFGQVVSLWVIFDLQDRQYTIDMKIPQNKATWEQLTHNESPSSYWTVYVDEVNHYQRIPNTQMAKQVLTQKAYQRIGLKLGLPICGDTNLI